MDTTATPHNAVHGMMENEYWNSFSSDFADYELGPPIGFGASSTVYAALYRPSLPTPPTDPAPVSPTAGGRPNLSIDIDKQDLRSHKRGVEKECAIKVSSHHPNVDQLFKEARLLSLSRHSNVLRVLASFTLPPDHQRIAIVTPLIPGGSLAGILDWRSRLATSPKPSPHLPRFKSLLRHEPESSDTRGRLQEEEIKAVVKQVLEGLVYLHDRGFIHRDLKAGNLLVEVDGAILLADFGVGGDINTPGQSMEKRLPGADQLRFGSMKFPQKVDSFDPSLKLEELKRRASFVGTPNWMAPEVISGGGYDSKADIWSLGITILELAHGMAPGANAKQNQIFTSIMTAPSPTLDRGSGHFSRAMKDFVDLCLIKVPGERPSATKLLEDHWLKGSRGKSFLAHALLDDVPPIEARQELRRTPSVMSMISRASSWDFNTSPTMPSTPARSSSFLPVRSPSILSQLVDPFSYDTSRSRSSSRIPSQPPSPRVSLRVWAENTAGERQGSDWRRSASETGRRRTASIRRHHSVSFDGARDERDSGNDSRIARRLPSMEEGLTMSPLVEASAGSPSRIPEMEMLGLKQMPELSGLKIMTAEPKPIDPLIEATSPKAPSMSRDGSAISSGSTQMPGEPMTPTRSTETSSAQATPTRSATRTVSPVSSKGMNDLESKKGWFKGSRGKKQDQGMKKPGRWAGILKRKSEQ